MKIEKFVTATIFTIILSGCTQMPLDTNERLGQFTAASSFNVRNLEYAKENGRKLRYILNFLPFMMQSFDYLIFLNVIVLGYEALPSRLYFKTIVVELILCMV